MNFGFAQFALCFDNWYVLVGTSGIQYTSPGCDRRFKNVRKLVSPSDKVAVTEKLALYMRGHVFEALK